ncbi:hypothetical protein, partial [Thiocystis minor]|uniref:hypothetical protein n=1 Tax=Thiocystis minor TaxID=61597 RepID=UPI001A92F8A9
MRHHAGLPGVAASEGMLPSRHRRAARGAQPSRGAGRVCLLASTNAAQGSDDDTVVEVRRVP